MAVPSVPVAGGPVAADWGQVAHDQAVATDTQVGSNNVTLTAQNANSVAVTFPRPFASAPIVVASLAGGSTTMFAGVGSVTATGFTLFAVRKDEATTSLTIAAHWHAIGPRA